MKHSEGAVLAGQSPSKSSSESVRRRERALGLVLTVGAHSAVFALLLWSNKPLASRLHPEPQTILVRVLDQPKRPEPLEFTAGEAAAQVPSRVPVAALAAPAVRILPPDNSDLLSQSQLAGAASVGEGGGGGGGCNIARIVQQALRRDSLVLHAVEQADRMGKAIMLWNGDWVRSGDQDGKGLSAVREAIMWEVGFAPDACRNEQMHGLILVSLADGGTRFAIGSDNWRWSDLLGIRGTTAYR